LCFAGTVLTTVEQEKSLPYELVLPAESANRLSESTLSKISQLPDVIAVTPLLQISAHIKTGEYSVQLILTGIDSSYLNGVFKEGEGFPESSVMPYIVLNESACKQFSNKNSETGPQMDASADISSNTLKSSGTDADSKSSSSSNTSTNTGSNQSTDSNGNSGMNPDDNTATGKDTDAPKIDWLNAGFSLRSGESGRWIVSKICGILASDDKEKEPAAYISLTVAKDLL
jgi:hypothetical protein